MINDMQSNSDSRRFHYTWPCEPGESKYFDTYESDAPGRNNPSLKCYASRKLQ